MHRRQRVLNCRKIVKRKEAHSDERTMVFNISMRATRSRMANLLGRGCNNVSRTRWRISMRKQKNTEIKGEPQRRREKERGRKRRRKRRLKNRRMEKREQITKSISARTRKPSSRLSYIFLDFSFFFWAISSASAGPARLQQWHPWRRQAQ